MLDSPTPDKRYACEYSANNGLRFAALLAGEPSSGDAELRQRAAALRRRVEFAMLPLVNVRGRELFERGDVRHQARRTPAELLGAAL